MIRALLALALAAQVSTSTAADAPVFATDLERELWETVVLLEGDLATATVALGGCETKRGRCELAALEPPPPPPPGDDAPTWWWVVAGLAAVLGASAVGYVVGHGGCPR